MQREGSLGGKSQKQVEEDTRSAAGAREKNHAEGPWEMRLSGEVELDYCKPRKPGRWIRI